MSRKPRYVVDTNVIVSALIFEQSVPGQAFFRALDRGDILLSRATLRELDVVLRRTRFDRYLQWDQRERFLVALTHKAMFLDTDQVLRVCRDPDDDKLLELAVCGQASCIITGDADLMALHPFRGIRIITPMQFVSSE